MEKRSEFFDHIKKAAESFKRVDKKETIRIVSHLDSDGICACSLLISALNKDNRKYSILIVHQLNEKTLMELKEEPYSTYIFTDIGSSILGLINQYLTQKTVFVLDHHEPENNPGKIIHINPHNFGIDGSNEIAGCGVVFLFARELDRSIDNMSHLAVIGAIGDVQEHDGFTGLNNDILDIAVKTNKINVEKGLRFFGMQTRPIHKVLEYSSDLIIPGVTGSESNAIQFLKEIGINPKKGHLWKRTSDLTEEEKRKLIAGIIMKRIDEDQPEDIFSNVYILPDEEQDSPFRDAKEFSTLLNACGRMNKASLGIGACLNDEKIKKKALKRLNEYRHEILKAINWYKENKGSDYITRNDHYMIINAEDNIIPTIGGTLASIITKSGELKDDFFIVILTRKYDKTTKISMRVTGKNPSVNLKEMIEEIVSHVKGQTGGHQFAAGAVIPTDKEDEFIQAAINVLDGVMLEERVD